MKVIIIALVMVGGGLYYQHYQDEQIRNAEFHKYYREVANPKLDELVAQCPQEGSAKIWCEAEAWQVWGKMMSKKKKEIWPNG
jgi:hypothetical protein